MHPHNIDGTLKLAKMFKKTYPEKNIWVWTGFLFENLKEKEVINCKDCSRLGYVADVEFDCETGKILAIIVPGPGKLFSCFGSGTEYYIRYCNIVRIGPDIVLVDIDACDIHKLGGEKHR